MLTSPVMDTITPEAYKTERKKRGTQKEVAAVLEVHPVTIAKREAVKRAEPITRESWLALLSLPLKKKSKPKT